MMFNPSQLDKNIISSNISVAASLVKAETDQPSHSLYQSHSICDTSMAIP